MVATDVASRGIGMIVYDSALPLLSFPIPLFFRLTSCEVDVVPALCKCALS